MLFKIFNKISPSTHFFIVSTLLLNFGIQLYFSINNDINNPIVNPIFPLTKDIIMLGYLSIFTFIGLKASINHNRLVVISLGTILFLMLTTSILKGQFLEYNFIRVIKNFFLYGFLLYLALPTITQIVGKDNFLARLNEAIYISLLCGSLLYFFEVSPSIDGRMYGTYGNPTSLGLVAIAGLLISYSIRKTINVRFLAELFIVSVVMCYTASISNVLFLLLAFPIIIFNSLFMRLMNKDLYKLELRQFTKNTIVAFILAPIFMVLVLLAGPVIKAPMLSQRIVTFIGTSNISFLLRSDSISVRYDDLKKLKAASLDSVKFEDFKDFKKDILNAAKFFALGVSLEKFQRLDSTAISFFVNFGIFALIAILSLIIYAIWKSYSSIISKKLSFDEMVFLAIVNSFLWLLFFNTLLQHQLEVFPSNLVLFTMLYFGTNVPSVLNTQQPLYPIKKL